jgi:hypothetical protein
MSSDTQTGHLYVLTTPSRTRHRSQEERAALEKAIKANEKLKKKLSGRSTSR